MDRFKVLFLALALVGAGLLPACSDSSGGSPDVVEVEEKPTIEELGGQDGIRTIMGSFMDKVLVDPSVNGYFLNGNFDDNAKAKKVDCLTFLVEDRLSGTDGFADNECTKVADAHKDLGISQADFDAIALNLTAAMREANIDPTHVNATLKVIAETIPDVVEDASSDATIYQRLGGKAGIASVTDDFLTRVLGDNTINSFFSSTNAGRLKTCLVRQICEATGGPCVLGAEVTNASEPGVADDNQCQTDMQTLHAGMVDGSSNPIDIDDFNALVGHLGAALDAAVGEEPPATYAADKAAIVAFLNSTCDDIVPSGTGCPAPPTL